MSIGVVIASLVIYFKPAWTIADPICTYLFSVIVCVTVAQVVKSCIQVLLEGSPIEIDSDALIRDIKSIENVESLNDFHLWSISMGKFALSAHITTSKSDASHEVIKIATNLCKVKYGIDHITIQMEDESIENEHQFECE